MTAPLMPKATAVWLVENTALTFRQIAKFCELHELEIQAIADGDVAYNIIGLSPVANNQLTTEEIARCEKDPAADLVANKQENDVKERNLKNKKILSPSQRNDRYAAILWIIKNYPDIIDSQIIKLVRTTKTTINAIREGTFKDIQSLMPKNPIAIGLCTESEMEASLRISQARLAPKTKVATKKKKIKKKTAKKAVVKKVATKKTATKKASAKKTTAKKVTTKKATIKKATSKKASAKKTTAKKTVTKKVATKKTTVKKAKTKKAAVKKTTTKKALTKKSTTKTAVAKKAVAKKTTVKKATTKKAPAKKATTKKTAEKKATSKKNVVKKAPTKKLTAKKK